MGNNDETNTYRHEAYQVSFEVVVMGNCVTEAVVIGAVVVKHNQIADQVIFCAMWVEGDETAWGYVVSVGVKVLTKLWLERVALA